MTGPAELMQVLFAPVGTWLPRSFDSPVDEAFSPSFPPDPRADDQITAFGDPVRRYEVRRYEFAMVADVAVPGEGPSRVVLPRVELRPDPSRSAHGEVMWVYLGPGHRRLRG